MFKVMVSFSRINGVFTFVYNSEEDLKVNCVYTSRGKSFIRSTWLSVVLDPRPFSMVGTSNISQSVEGMKAL